MRKCRTTKRRWRNPVRGFDATDALADGVLMMWFFAKFRPIIKELKDEIKHHNRIEIPLAIEYGFKGYEKAWNLERTLAEWRKNLVLPIGTIESGVAPAAKKSSPRR